MNTREIKKKTDRKCTYVYDATLKRVSSSIVAVGKICYVHKLCFCVSAHVCVQPEVCSMPS